MEAAKPKFMMAKVKALKVLDAKSAQNICKDSYLSVCLLPYTCLSVCPLTPPLPHSSPAGLLAYGFQRYSEVGAVG